MKSKTQFLFFSALLITILIISGITLNKTNKTEKKLTETKKSLSNTITFMDNLADQQQMKQKMDSIQVSPGEKAPDFALQDQNGNTTTLNSLGNKKKLLVFSSATCSTCKEFYPELNTFMKSQNDITIAVLQIDGTAEENKNVLKKNNYLFNILNANDSIFSDYKVVSTPTSILVDHTNNIMAEGDLRTYNDIVSFIKSFN